MRILLLIGLLVGLGVLVWLGATIVPQDLRIGGAAKEQAQRAANLIEDAQNKIKNATPTNVQAMAISPEDKSKIDAWIREAGRNDFGDVLGTVYAGGSPLFEELSGKAIDKYDYILNKYPELVSQLKLNIK